MTVVVAGFDASPPSSPYRRTEFLEDNPWDGFGSPKEQVGLDEQARYSGALESPTAAFVLADSLLSREIGGGRLPTAETAEKVFEIDIEISKPEFDPSGFPTGRAYKSTTFSCGVAYAGSVAMSQLVIDRFRQAMKNLRYTWIDGKWKGPGRYAICAMGDAEDITAPSNHRISYTDDIDFARRSLPPLEADFAAGIFARCFNEALKDHFPKEAEFRPNGDVDIKIEFVLLAFCQSQNAPRIYRLTWADDRDVFPLGSKSVRQEVEYDEFVVLGHSSWTPEMIKSRNDAIESRTSVQTCTERRLTAMVRAHESENFVGGAIKAGRLNYLGFQKRL